MGIRSSNAGREKPVLFFRIRHLHTLGLLIKGQSYNIERDPRFLADAYASTICAVLYYTVHPPCPYGSWLL